MDKEKSKLEILRLIAQIHIFGGTILIGFITFFKDNSSKLQINSAILILVYSGIVAFFAALFYLFFSYDDRSGKIVYKKLKSAFLISILSLGLFVFAIMIILPQFNPPVILTARGSCLIPYPISGIIKMNEKPVNSATVYVKNIYTREEETTVTNEFGQYIIELANFKGCYGDKDLIQVKACNIDNVCASKQTVVDINKGDSEVNIEISS